MLVKIPWFLNRTFDYIILGSIMFCIFLHVASGDLIMTAYATFALFAWVWIVKNQRKTKGEE